MFWLYFWRFCKTGHAQHLRIVGFVASCNKRALNLHKYIWWPETREPKSDKNVIFEKYQQKHFTNICCSAQDVFFYYYFLLLRQIIQQEQHDTSESQQSHAKHTVHYRYIRLAFISPTVCCWLECFSCPQAISKVLFFVCLIVCFFFKIPLALSRLKRHTRTSNSSVTTEDSMRVCVMLQIMWNKEVWRMGFILHISIVVCVLRLSCRSTWL